MRKTVLLAAVAVMITLAGCAGAGPTTDSAVPTDGGPADDSTTGATDDTTDSEQSGTVAFYLSDAPNDIDDFSHLNVTVTEVQFHYAGSDDEADDDGGNETTPELTVATTSTVETEDGNESEPGNGDEAGPPEEAGADDEDESDEQQEAADGTDTDDEGDGDEETEAADDEERADDTESESGWITREVNGTSVDLTELQGANATLLENFSVPSGEYTQVRLVVGEINATLTDGSDQEVKLPSERLKLNKPFTLGPNSSVDFVFDITVRKAGNSGKYVLQPVAGESGPDQEIERRDD